MRRPVANLHRESGQQSIGAAFHEGRRSDFLLIVRPREENFEEP